MDILRLARWVAFFCITALLAASIVGLPIAILMASYGLVGFRKAIQIETEHPDIQPEDWLSAPIATTKRLVDKEEERKAAEHAAWRQRVNQPDYDPFE